MGSRPRGTLKNHTGFNCFVIHFFLNFFLLKINLFFFKERKLLNPSVEPEHWLEHVINNHNTSNSNAVHIPHKMNGEDYKVFSLFDDQQVILATILKTLHDWVTMEDKTKFKPLRLILNGSGGTGKSVLINTLVTVMRKMFDNDKVVHITAPTGAAAFNVNGETIHRLMEINPSDPDYIPGTMSSGTKQRLLDKLRTTLALIIDERSLLGSNLFGNTELKFKETIFGGLLSELDWGGLPILILVGDDYQLPPVKKEGGLEVLLNNTKEGNRSKSTIHGKRKMKQCAEFVMELHRSRRLKEGREQDRQLINRIRLAYDIPGINDEEKERLVSNDVKKLLSLHLSAIATRHGDEVCKQIEEKSIYLYYRNEPRIKKNTECLANCCSPQNPVAFCPVFAFGKHGKAVRGHFKEEAPENVLLCVGSRVSLENRNFFPSWGLHNGACGTVQEIVFGKGTNPNNKQLPQYIVIDFPQYCGPIWDVDHPTVSSFFFLSFFFFRNFH